MDIRINLTTKPELPVLPTIQLWRVPHDVERYNIDAGDFRYAGARVGVVRKTIRDAGVARPEIYRCYPDHTTRIGEKHQWLWKDINPELSGYRWRTLLGNKLAWTNQTGFPGHKDFVNKLDLTLGYPTFHATLVNGGMILEGEEDGNIVWIKSLLVNEPVPSADDLLKTHKWFWGTSVIPSSGDIGMITRLGVDGTYKKVKIPFLTTLRVYLPKAELHKLPLNSIPPSPTWIVGS